MTKRVFKHRIQLNGCAYLALHLFGMRHRHFFAIHTIRRTAQRFPAQFGASAFGLGLRVTAFSTGNQHHIVGAVLNVQRRLVHHRLHKVAAKLANGRFSPGQIEAFAQNGRGIGIGPATAHHAYSGGSLDDLWV